MQWTRIPGLTALGKTDVPSRKLTCFAWMEGILGTPFYVMVMSGTGLLECSFLIPLDQRFQVFRHEWFNCKTSWFMNPGTFRFGRPDIMLKQLSRWKQYRVRIWKVPEMDLLIEWLHERIPDQIDFLFMEITGWTTWFRPDKTGY